MDMNDSLHDDSLLSNTPPSAKRQKKDPPAKKSSGKPLKEIDNESYEFDGAADDAPQAKGAGSDKTATERYHEVRLQQCGGSLAKANETSR